MKTCVIPILSLVLGACVAMRAAADEPRAASTDVLAALAGLDAPAPPSRPREAAQVPREETAGYAVAWSEADSLYAGEPAAARSEAGPVSATVMAESRPQQLAELYDRVLEMEPNAENRRLIQRVRAATQATEVGVDVSDEEWIHVKDTSLTWGGRLEGDWVNWANDSQFGGQTNYVEFRRLRLFAAGEGYGVYDYRLELEFAPEVELQADVEDDHVDLGGFGVELKDAYLGIHDLPWLGYLRFGHFKAPIGLEELTSSRYITFLERSLPHRLVPGRELGLAAFNHSLGENVTWAYGAFFDEMSESAHAIEDDNEGTRVVGRVTWTPRYDELSMGRYLIHTGLAYCYTRPRKEDDPLGLGADFRPVHFSARPEIHRGDPLVDTGDINTRQYHVLDGELAWVRGPLSVQSEVVWASLERMEGGATDLYGAYVFASYFLTGEHRTYDRQSGTFDRITPFENFWIVNTPGGRRAGWGAWEIAARWSYLDFSEVAGQQLNDLSVGCNWYWNPHCRMMLNWIHPFAHDSPVAAADDAQGDIVAMRLHVDF